MIIYIWKTIETKVKNINNKIVYYNNDRQGRKIQRRRVVKSRLSKKVEANILVHGAKLFNILPKHIRNITNVKIDVFKQKLDVYLRQITDEPQIIGLTALRRAETNSLTHMINSYNRDNRGRAYQCSS